MGNFRSQIASVLNSEELESLNILESIKNPSQIEIDAKIELYATVCVRLFLCKQDVADKYAKRVFDIG